MATLILTAVGTAIGGPIGGAIGSILGQSLDRNLLFAPKARHGPRLRELAVQTSSYGVRIPKIFGTMRVAGVVIWSTDLIESRSTSGGKGRPKTVNYSYSASFAVALSARPVRGVGRIWADGKLLRGAAGDFKSATEFRLHLGDEDQEPDPLIVSSEGLGETPAFRGLAYAVFEDFQLEDYGNRIPSLTFEVEADAGDVSVGSIAEEVSGGLVSAGETPSLGGYAAGGDSVRDAIEGLTEILPMPLSDDGEVLRLAATGDPVAIPVSALSGRLELIRSAGGSLPREVSLTYYDRDRDYQTGLQRATTGQEAARGEAQALPAALGAGEAKALAELRLAALRARRTRAKLTLGWDHAGLRPGARLSIEGESGLWTVRWATIAAMSVALELQRAGGGLLPGTASASPGQGETQPDAPHGPTTLRLLDVPIGEPAGARPLLFVAAAGVEPGWRRAALLISFDAGETWEPAGATAAPAVMGEALNALGPGPPCLFDDASSVEIELLNAEMWLESASDSALIGGANLALLGDELIQFGRADWLGDRRFRLSRLLRGRRGTEWASGSHAAGDAFALIERASLAPLDVPAERLGGMLTVSASGIGDAEAVTASADILGESLRPPAPVHLTAHRLDSGDIRIDWVRRSRLGWSWPSGADTPLGEESESYRLEISGDGFLRAITLAAPSYFYTAADQAADGASEPLHLSVRQLGTHAMSRASHLVFE